MALKIKCAEFSASDLDLDDVVQICSMDFILLSQKANGELMY